MSAADRTVGNGSMATSGRASMSDGAMVNKVLSGLRLAGIASGNGLGELLGALRSRERPL